MGSTLEQEGDRLHCKCAATEAIGAYTGPVTSVRATAVVGFTSVVVSLLACGRAVDAVSSDASSADDPAATASAQPAAVPDGRPSRQSASPEPVAPREVAGPSPSTNARPAGSMSVAVPPARPLADWMRGGVTAAFNSGNLESIAATFDRMARGAPAGFENWRSIANDGANAARSGSLEGAKAACRGCHGQYEARYKQTLSTLPIPL